MTKQIPITINFDNERIIGFADIDLSKIPKQPNYVFSIAVMVKDALADGTITDSELVQLALMHQDDYKKYLESEHVKF